MDGALTSLNSSRGGGGSSAAGADGTHRSLLARLIPDFAFGSLADEKLAALTKSSATDLLGLAPPPKSSLFRLAPRPSPDVSSFRRRLLTPS